MKATNITEEAMNQVRGVMGEITLNDRRFTRLNSWTLLGMLLLESQEALKLSKKYNELETIDTMEQVRLAQALFRRVSLDKNQVFKGGDALKEIHERMIETRNKFAAHNADNDFDAAIVATQESDEAIIMKFTYTLATPLNEYDDYQKVIEHCSDYVVWSANKYLNHLQNEVCKEIKFG